MHTRTFMELREDREAKQAAAAFDRRSNKKTTLTFFALLKHFLDPKLTTKDIAQIAGMDTVVLSKMYGEWFAEFVGFESARERELFGKWCAVPLVTHARRAAEAAGFTFAFPKYETRSQHTRAFLSQSAMIGGTFCSLRELSRVRRMSQKCKQLYAYTTVHEDLLKVFSHLVIRFAVEGYDERWYILPTRVVLEKKFAHREHGPARLVIPATPRGAYSQEPDILFDSYQNAWHLLAPSALQGTQAA